MARCKACDKDMKSTSGDEYWREVNVNGKKVKMLEDLCRKCRSYIHLSDDADDWKQYIEIEVDETTTY